MLSVQHGLKSLIQSARIYISVILQQGWDIKALPKIYVINLSNCPGIPSSDEGHFLSTKFAVFLLFVYSFLLFQFYSASIVGSLLMAPPKIIKTIPDLTKSRLQIGIQDIVYNYEFFKVSPLFLSNHVSNRISICLAHQRFKCIGIVLKEGKSSGQTIGKLHAELLSRQRGTPKDAIRSICLSRGPRLCFPAHNRHVQREGYLRLDNDLLVPPTANG